MSDQKDDENLIPIDIIDRIPNVEDETFVPHTLVDDPDAGDGSVGRAGVEISPWRLHKLGKDKLGSISDPTGDDRKSQRTRRLHDASRKARTSTGRKHRKRAHVVIATLVVLAIACAAYAAASYMLEEWGGKTIPYVAGMSQTNAVEQLEAKGFTVTTEEVPSDTVSGHVVDVKPQEGTRVDEGTKVHLTIGVSRTVPEVVGMSREEARTTLEAAGAQNIRFETQVAAEEEDRVLEVSPSAGSVFLSSEEINVIVSQLPRMLDVVGEEKDLALLHLEREGIQTETSYEKGDAKQRMHVIRTEPGAGQAVGGEGARLFVGDPLIEVQRVEDYFDADAPHISEFLQGAGYAPKVGYKGQDDQLVARFANDEGISVSFVKEPWLHNIDSDQSGYGEVMDDSAHIEGVRLTIPLMRQVTKTVPQQDESGQTTEKTVTTEETVDSVMGIEKPTVGESTAKDVMKACGLENMQSSCTQSTIILPKGSATSGHAFYCCNGESAQNVWTILIKGTSTSGKLAATDIVVTCVPKSVYAAIDLTQYDNKVCNYVAYQDVFK